MTRREFLSAMAAATAAAAPSGAEAPLILPVHRVTDTRAKIPPERRERFETGMWPEAVRDFARCGVQIQSSEATGEVKRSPGDWPVLAGLKGGAINLILTNRVPMRWDHGRGLAGVATRQDGIAVCLIALDYAHGHRVPFVSVNTCVHELLHVVLQDVFMSRPAGWSGEGRELRIDWYATRLWLLHDGSVIRNATQA